MLSTKTTAILERIKQVVSNIAPQAEVYLFGSYSRGEEKEHSDIDILVLLAQDQLTRQDEKNIKYPIYEIEFEIGKVISVFICTKKDWENKLKKNSFL